MDGLPPGQRGRALLTIAIAIGVAVLDSTVANIALPSISRELQVTPAATVWVVSAYQLVLTMTMLPVATLGDIYGHRRIYTIGLVVFTLASLGCALSTSLPMLVTARVIQGFGGAGIMAVNGSLIRYIFPRSMLGRGLGINSMIVAVSTALGPSIASAILSVADWPWLFAVNVPLGALALALVGALPTSPRASHRFDIVSAALSGCTFGLFVFGLSDFGHGEDWRVSVTMIALCLVTGWLFVRRQLALPTPMLPMDLFRRPIFSLSVLTAVLSFCAQTAAFVALPFLFQSVGGVSAIGTGLLMTPWPVAVALLAPIVGRLADRIKPGVLGSVGLVVMGVGLLTLALLPAHAPWWDVGWRMALTGAGFALFQTPNNRLLVSSVPRERSGVGSGVLATTRLLGQSTGAALAAVAFGLTQTHGGVARGALVALLIGAGSSAMGGVVSSLRLSRAADRTR
jgi:DHA2 family multidrug resistance protein-like MFS transporter